VDGSRPSFNSCFLGELSPNSISIGSAVFAGLTNVTNRQTDRHTGHATPSVVIGRIWPLLRCGLIMITFLCITVKCNETDRPTMRKLSHSVKFVINWTVILLADATVFCAPGLCQHHGICHEAARSFRCDCNMTSFVGRTCADGMTSLHAHTHTHGCNGYFRGKPVLARFLLNFLPALVSNLQQVPPRTDQNC